MESGVAEGQVSLLHDGKPVDLAKTFEDQGIKHGDMLVVASSSKAATLSAAAPPRVPSTINREMDQFREYILSDAAFQEKLQASNPALLEAALSNSSQFPRLVQELQVQLNPQAARDAEKASLYVPPGVAAMPHAVARARGRPAQRRGAAQD